MCEEQDSYDKFIEDFHTTTDDFIEWGIENLIKAERDNAQIYWEKLKSRIIGESIGETVYFRSKGNRSTESTGAVNKLISQFYQDEDVFGEKIRVKADPTNNNAPQKMLYDTIPGYRKTEQQGKIHLKNYQISHVWGKTKNIFMFTAPWNVVYLPKIVDPLSGHEADSKMRDSFQTKLRTKVYDAFETQINDYNELVETYELAERSKDFFESQCPEFMTDSEHEKFMHDMVREFEPIKRP